MRLRRSDLAAAGITRRRRGKGFTYRDSRDQPVTDPETLARIKALVIPPAWRDVWISPYPAGHIQAVRTDAAGRRQYRYHDEWRRKRDLEKFDRILDFAEMLPALRRRVKQDLELPGMPERRVLACAARMLDIGFFRVGGEEYAEQNSTFGLATIRREHTSVDTKRAVTRAVKETSDYLGNTPAVCRASYIHPRVIDLFAGGVTIHEDLQSIGDGAGYGQLAFQGDVEAAVVALLRSPQAARAASRRVRLAQAAEQRAQRKAPPIGQRPTGRAA